MSDQQGYLPGTEPPRIAELDELGVKFRELRDEWQRLGKEMQDAKADLLEAMEQHADNLAEDSDGNRVYPIPDTEHEIALIQSDNVKVRKRTKID